MMVQIPRLSCPTCDVPIRSMTPRFTQHLVLAVQVVEAWEIDPCGHVVYDTLETTLSGSRWIRP